MFGAGAVAELFTNCTSLTPLIMFDINAVRLIRFAITPPVGELIPPGAITVDPNPVSCTVTLELKLNEPKPLMFGFVNGPDAKLQKPF